VHEKRRRSEDRRLFFYVAVKPRPSGRRSDIGIVAGRAARTPSARGLDRRLALDRRDGGRQDLERDPLLVHFLAVSQPRLGPGPNALGPALAVALVAIFALGADRASGAIVATGTALVVAGVVANRAIVAIVARLVAGGAILAVVAAEGPIVALVADGPIVAIVAGGTLIAVVAIVPLVAIVVAVVGGDGGLVLILVLVRPVIVALAPLLLEADPAFVEHPEIMLGILEIIFGLDAVALKLRVAGERLVFLEKLAGIAARAVLRPAVAGVRRLVRRAWAAPAAAPAAVLTIVYQK
jgi:hypothetical protein